MNEHLKFFLRVYVRVCMSYAAVQSFFFKFNLLWLKNVKIILLCFCFFPIFHSSFLKNFPAFFSYRYEKKVCFRGFVLNRVRVGTAH